jgi:hypothetical protein
LKRWLTQLGFVFVTMLAVLAQACMLSPNDKQLVGSKNATLNPWGYHVNPSSLIEIKAFNYGTGKYDTLTTATSSATVSLNYGPADKPVALYYWASPNLQLGPAYWQDSPKGPVARVRGESGGYNLMSTRSDWGKYVDLGGNIRDFMSDAAGEHNPDAYLYACPLPTVAKDRYSIQEVPACARTMIVEAILAQITRHPPAAGTPDTSIDRHYTIVHHDPNSFFNDHRKYLHDMETAVAKLLPVHPWMPNGHLPFWDPTVAMPTELRNAIAPSPQVCSTSRSCTDGWAVGPFANPGLTRSLPTALTDANICSITTLEHLHHAVDPWHGSVHTGVGGMFGTFDSPAAALFWPWHTYVDMLYAKWQACPH